MKKEEGEESGKGDKYRVEEEGKGKNVERGSGERNEGGGGSSKRKEE